jgi:outer membrane lipoprotein
MKPKKIRRYASRLTVPFFFLFLLGVLGCANKPISEQYRKEAKAENLNFRMVLQNPDAYVGGIVLWGGIIIKATPLKNGSELIVLETPIGRDEIPKSASQSEGRFIAVSSKFLDPAIYTRGKRITLAGKITGKKTLILGETTYTYPVIQIRQLVYWEMRLSYDFPNDYWEWGEPWAWGAYWNRPYWYWESYKAW